MAIKSKEEILNEINALIGAETTDEVLMVIEDVTDTFDDLVSRASTDIEWEDKYNKLDADWREKYRARFFEGSEEGVETVEETAETVVDEETPTTYDDLFEEE